MANSIKYLIVSIITFIVGYIYLRLAYTNTSENPFGQEIVLIVLGTVVTIAITAALLNKQSEIEIEKEQRVKVFDMKSGLYFDLINFIEELIRKEKIDSKDLITLEFLTHKISIIANPEVLHEYANLIQVIKKTSADTKISDLESDALSGHLAKLCGKIRYDLLPREDQDLESTLSVIESNIQKI